MLRLAESHPDATLIWQGIGESDPEYGRDHDTLDSVISTPVIQGDYVYGVDGEGNLRCLELRTGRRVWETAELIRDPARWATAFFVRHGDRYFINTDGGDLVIARFSPEGLRGNQPHAPDRADQPLRAAPGAGAVRQLVASGLREPARHCTQR